MNDKKYEVRFLPLFEEDLYSIVSYIAEHLKNPAAEYVAEFLKILQHCRIKEDIGYIMFSNIGLRHAIMSRSAFISPPFVENKKIFINYPKDMKNIACAQI